MNLLVVDDDLETLEFLDRALVQDGHLVSVVASVDGARDALTRTHFDAMILDVMLGQASGIAFCAELRRSGVELPILFLSARGTVGARVEGLEAGGDDYLPKPFALRELKARVRALGRRGRARTPDRLISGPYALDFDQQRAEVGGHEVPITAREWDILEVLAGASGAVVTYEELLDRVWGEATPSRRASLAVIVSRLRGKLRNGDQDSILRTIRNRGYALRMEP